MKQGIMDLLDKKIYIAREKRELYEFMFTKIRVEYIDVRDYILVVPASRVEDIDVDDYFS